MSKQILPEVPIWMDKMLYTSVQALFLAANAQYWNSSELHNVNLTYLKHQNVPLYDIFRFLEPYPKIHGETGQAMYGIGY